MYIAIERGSIGRGPEDGSGEGMGRGVVARKGEHREGTGRWELGGKGVVARKGEHRD